MSRTIAITGSASGIGAATRGRLDARGHRVIGIDQHDADVVADLSTREGRAHAVAQVVEASNGTLDAVICCAGVSAFAPITVQVNYFGAVAVLEGLRPLLAAGATPRAVAIVSLGIVHPVEDDVVAACLAGDEAAATALPGASGPNVYASSKRALARWIRRTAPSEAWAGAGITLNGIAPGTVETPMTAPLLDDPAASDFVDAAVPMPLAGHARADEIAPLLDFLTGPDNTQITGQVVFVDGGADAVLRGDDIWESVTLPEFTFDIDLS